MRLPATRAMNKIFSLTIYGLIIIAYSNTRSVLTGDHNHKITCKSYDGGSLQFRLLMIDDDEMYVGGF